MLFRCNLLALVGGGRNPKFPPNVVKIWDDHQNRAIGELMFRSEVKAVRLRRDRVVVVLLNKIYIYRFSDLKLLDQISTLENPKGLIALCPDSSSVVLACPGVTKGNVRVELYDLRKSQLIPAHESELAAIALNQQGTRLATASDKGTLLRVFDTHTGELLKELRRGMERAGINCICFNRTTEFLACSSNKGTVHVFSVVPKGTGRTSSGSSDPSTNPNGEAIDARHTAAAPGPSTPVNNATSNFALLRRIIPGVPKYVDSEWSFAQVHGLEARTICAFGQAPSSIIVVGADGSYLLSSFACPGECERLSFARFTRPSNAEIRPDGVLPARPSRDPANQQEKGGGYSPEEEEEEGYRSAVIE